MDAYHLSFLLASIASSTLIALIFKWFTLNNIKSFQAIVVNYLTCVLLGSLLMGRSPFQGAFWQEDWFPYSIGLGFLFISGFYAIAKTIEYFGVTVGTVMQKMALILTVTFAILYYKESTHWMRITGILIALAAVVLTNIKADSEDQDRKRGFSWLILIPIFVFFDSGSIEIIMQYVKLSLLGDRSELGFTTFLFGTAGVLGFLFLVGGLMTGQQKLDTKSLLAGVALGIPNFFSIYCLLVALGSDLDASILFTVNNISIIGLSVLLAYLLFNERLSRLNILGVLLAILSILLILWAG
ncbi:MAG: EamA family transporter [Bacteroidota bacterium]